MNVIKIHPDGRREKVLGYGDITLDAGRKAVKGAAEAEAADHPAGTASITERIIPRGDLRVYAVMVHSAAGEPIATFEEEWQSPNAAEARTLFDRVQELDGYGHVTTDDDLLAETIADMLDVRPEEVYAEYSQHNDDEDDEDEDEDEDEGVSVAPVGTKMLALCTPQGTACYEAGLCSACDTPERRAAVEAATTTHDRRQPEYDRPILGEWHDVTGNDAVACQQCGKTTITEDCERCGSPRNGGDYCTDPTCPFSDHAPTCPAGWAGHPDKGPTGGRAAACTCRNTNHGAP